MRIDFLGRYKQVSELINSPDRQGVSQSGERHFGDTLADIAPQYLQDAESAREKVTLSSEALHLADRDKHFRAQLNLSSVELSAPQFQPVEPGPVETEAFPAISPDVKTPTVVSIERHGSNEPVTSGTRRQAVAEVRELVQSAGARFGVDPVLGMAVVARESSFNSRAVSSDGHASKGLFQLLDRTGRDLLNRLGLESEYKPFDPEQNVYLGVGYLKHLHDIFSTETELSNKTKTVVAANNSSLEKLAVAAFNAGEGRVASAQQRALQAGKDPSQYDHIEDYLPESTQQYVSRVLEAKAQFAGPLSAPVTVR